MFCCHSFPINTIQLILFYFLGYIDFSSSNFKWRPRHNYVHFVNNTHIFFLNNLNSIFFTLKLQISIDLNFHTQCRCLTNNKWLIFENHVNFFSWCHFESDALSRSPKQLSVESRIWCLEKFNWSQMEL